jgi:hypothetical protein
MTATLARERLDAAIDAILACAEACTTCADECLGEEAMAELTATIETDLSCADVCSATAQAIAAYDDEHPIPRAQLEACITACRTCAEECESQSGDHEHCMACAEACRAGEMACLDLLTAFG